MASLKRDWTQAWAHINGPLGNGESDTGNICPMCANTDIPSIDGNGVCLCCKRCGYVYETIPDDHPDAFTKESGTSEPAQIDVINPLMPHASMNTDISFNGRLVYTQYQMIKLNRWSSLSPMERSLYVVFNKLEQCCNRSSVPTGVQYAAKVCY